MNQLTHWSESKIEICNLIEKRNGILKIILKTKNEQNMLEDWIDYHSKIVGLENIIILDHNSDDKFTLDVYNRINHEAVCFRFSGFIDLPHNPKYFSELYRAISRSCDYFIFLDTDERLTLITDDLYTSNKNIVKFVSDMGGNCFAPGTWLHNLPGHKDRFRNITRGHLCDGLRWGKPVLPAKFLVSDIQHHNCQAYKFFCRQEKICTNLFVLHLTHLIVEQRVKANFYKLQQLKVIDWTGEFCDQAVESIRNINLDSITHKNGRRYIHEIQELAKLPENYKSSTDASVLLSCDGPVEFASDKQRVVLSDFLGMSRKDVNEVLE